VEEDPREIILDNGVKVAIEGNSSSYSVSLGILVKVGAKDEGEKAGIAHLLEHMLFKGSEHYDRQELARITDMLGGDFNGLTHKDYTLYYIRAPYDKLELATSILVDIFKNPLLSPEELEKEKQVILEEMRERDNSPEEVAKEQLLSLVWDGHPLGRSILGFEETLLSITSDDLRDFLSLYHYPEAITISAAGRIDESSFLGELEKRLGNLKGRKKEGSKEPKFQPGEKELLYATNQVHLCLAMESSKASEESHYAYGVLATLLGGGSASRLFQKLREERGLCYDVEAEDLALEDTGLLNIYTASHPSNKRILRELIEEELISLRDKGVEREELERSKEQMKNAILLSLDSSLQRMIHLALSLLYRGRIIPLKETLEKIEGIKEEDIQQAISHSLAEGLASLYICPVANTPK